MKASDLPTPCAVVDPDVVDRNTARMSERIRRLGASLRPHVKTHKTVEGARLQVRGHSGAITVSTLAEARFFAEAGFRDILYAFPVPLPRLAEIASLQSGIDALHLLVDQEASLKGMQEFAAAKGVRFSALLKVDCGDHRAGVDPESDDAVRLAKRLSESEAIDFRGILTHAGHSYGSADAGEIRRIAGDERRVMVDFAGRLREAGIEVRELSVGSTPTMSHTDSMEGLTEARPGNYAFYDVFQSTIGSCAPEDRAFSVLATVAGHYPAQNKMIVDAGALALSKDAGPTHVNADAGFGAVTSLDGRTSHPELTVAALSQEHGQVRGREKIDFARFPVGSKIRIHPNHSCLTAAMFDRYHAVKGGEVVGEWKPVKGW